MYDWMNKSMRLSNNAIAYHKIYRGVLIFIYDMTSKGLSPFEPCTYAAALERESFECLGAAISEATNKGLNMQFCVVGNKSDLQSERYCLI